jgi:hypothetical protein
MSATSARTVRAMMPIGITDIVTAGRIRYCMCAQSQPSRLEPPGPAPGRPAASSAGEKMITSTMPSQ